LVHGTRKCNGNSTARYVPEWYYRVARHVEDEGEEQILGRRRPLVR